MYRSSELILPGSRAHRAHPGYQMPVSFYIKRKQELQVGGGFTAACLY